MYLRPVLRLGAARAGLDIEIGTVCVHLATEHPAEFELAHLRFERGDFPFDVGHGRGVIFRLGELEQFGGVAQRRTHGVELFQVGGQPRAFAAEFLRAGRVDPDILLLQLTDHFLQTLFLGVVVKETPGARRRARRDRAGSS